jgi:hypothetical protein
MFAWLGAKALFGLSRWIWVAVAITALIGAVVWLQARENADNKANVAIGRTIEREEALTETIKQVEEAQDAREDNRNRDAEQRHSDCLRRSRNPENC